MSLEEHDLFFKYKFCNAILYLIIKVKFSLKEVEQLKSLSEKLSDVDMDGLFSTIFLLENASRSRSIKFLDLHTIERIIDKKNQLAIIATVLKKLEESEIFYTDLVAIFAYPEIMLDNLKHYDLVLFVLDKYFFTHAELLQTSLVRGVIQKIVDRELVTLEVFKNIFSTPFSEKMFFELNKVFESGSVDCSLVKGREAEDVQYNRKMMIKVVNTVKQWRWVQKEQKHVQEIISHLHRSFISGIGFNAKHLLRDQPENTILGFLYGVKICKKAVVEEKPGT